MIDLPVTLALAIPGLDGLGKIVVFLVMLSILVVLHEAGHFWLARWNGVRVNDFAVGFGPTLLKWTSKRSGTNYRFNLLPIGGYCAMQGEDGKTSEAEQQRTFRQHVEGQLADDNFQSKSPLRRLSIVVAGPIANFILAYAILFVAATTFGIAGTTYTTQIGPLEAGSPGAKAGLQVGDRITAIDGVPFSSGEKLVDKIKASAGIPLSITYVRHGSVQTVRVTPRADKVDGKTIGRIGFLRIPEFQRVNPIAAVPVAGAEFYNALAGQLSGYAELFSHPVQHASSLSGVIGMERAASEYQDLGWAPYLSLAAAISIALGVLNLLPFPALDGGRAVFILAEMLRGRPVEAEKEALVHVTGFAVLMVLMIAVAYHDIANIVSGKGVF
jgi:regulator of sigma E protease